MVIIALLDSFRGRINVIRGLLLLLLLFSACPGYFSFPPFGSNVKGELESGRWQVVAKKTPLIVSGWWRPRRSGDLPLTTTTTISCSSPRSRLVATFVSSNSQSSPKHPESKKNI